MKNILSISVAAVTSLVVMFSLPFATAYARGGADDGIRGHDAEVAAGLEDERGELEMRGHDAEVAAGLEDERGEFEVRGHDAEVAAGLEAEDANDVRREDRRADRQQDANDVPEADDDNDNVNRGPSSNSGPGNSEQISADDANDIQEMINALVARIMELERQILSLLSR